MPENVHVVPGDVAQMRVDDLANRQLPVLRTDELVIRVADEDVDAIRRYSPRRLPVGGLELASYGGGSLADLLLGQSQLT